MPKKVKKPEYTEDLGKIDITELTRLIKLIPAEIWESENSRKENKFAVFHSTQHIIFRFIRGMKDHREFYSTPIWNVWRAALEPLMDVIASRIRLNAPVYPKAMFAKLKAGGVIDPHRDGAGSNLYTHKIHIPIETSDAARMCIKDKWFHLETGRAYEVNNIVAHEVKNEGTKDRIHFIFEMFERQG